MRRVRNLKLQDEMSREEVRSKQLQAARGHDLAGDDLGDEVADMTPEEFLEFIGKADRVRITNPLTRRALRRKLRAMERERSMLTRCIVQIRGLIGD